MDWTINIGGNWVKVEFVRYEKPFFLCVVPAWLDPKAVWRIRRRDLKPRAHKQHFLDP